MKCICQKKGVRILYHTHCTIIVIYFAHIVGRAFPFHNIILKCVQRSVRKYRYDIVFVIRRKGPNGRLLMSPADHVAGVF